MYRYIYQKKYIFEFDLFISTKKIICSKISILKLINKGNDSTQVTVFKRITHIFCHICSNNIYYHIKYIIKPYVYPKSCQRRYIIETEKRVYYVQFRVL